MTKEEIKKNIESLKNAKFQHSMKDRWTVTDFARDEELRIQIRELEKMLEDED